MIIVTGGTGLVGKALQRLHPEFIYLGSKDGDLRSLEETKQIFEKHQPTGIIHLACIVGGLYKNINSNYEMFMDNMSINNNIMQCCKDYNVKHGLFILSTCVFPDKTEYPINETMLHNGAPHCSNEGYAYAKRNLEIMCRLHNKKYGTKFICVIPTNIYGTHDNFNLEDAHVIPNLIHKTLVADKENRPLTLRGSGKALRQFLFVDDFAKMLSKLLNSEIEEELVVCAPREEISIQLLTDMIVYLYEFENGVDYDLSYSDGQYKKTADGGTFNRLFPEFRYTSLLDGLKKTIDWFKQNYPNIRM
jgi:GDP-L-fucose synthase